MGTYEVTQAQYKAVMNAEPSHFDGDQRPVEKVNWNDAIEFCNRVNTAEAEAGRVPPGYTYTLPTEAEWEFACRAGTTTPFAIGDGSSLSSHQANFYGPRPYGGAPEGPYLSRTSDVGSYNLPNPWGFHDMHGNVYEWCYDQYGSYPSGSVTDHLGTSSSYRVGRGGGWSNDARGCRSANRRRYTPGYRSDRIGFRLCLSPVAR